MKVSSLLYLLSLLPSSLCAGKWFFPNSEREDFPHYIKGSEVLIECPQRKIDHGDFKLDSRHHRMFKSFPKCRETHNHLSFKYGVNEDLSCTFVLSDEIFHLFQLYVHEETPFTCTLPLDPQNVREGNENGFSVPFSLNLRGEVGETFLEIDNHVNVIVQTPKAVNSIVSGVAWSSGTNLSRVERGGYLTLNFAVRWMRLAPKESKGGTIPFKDGFYVLPGSLPYELSWIVTVIAAILCILSSVFTYYIASKVPKSWIEERKSEETKVD